MGGTKADTLHFPDDFNVVPDHKMFDLKLRVDPEAKARVGFEYLPEGWRITKINPKPGQPNLKVNDVIVAVEGVFITEMEEKMQIKTFQFYFKDNMRIKILRKGVADV